jgi:hypothetical protein
MRTMRGTAALQPGRQEARAGGDDRFGDEGYNNPVRMLLMGLPADMR